MTPKLLIRISATLVFIHLIGHTLGHMGWDDENGPLYNVVKEMKSHSAVFMGATKSMADYFIGYSLIMSGLFVLSISIFWILSNHTETNQKLVRQILFLFGIAYISFGVVEYIYFFPFAALISLMAGVFAIAAAFKLEKQG